jgi:hypothetical protein
MLKQIDLSNLNSNSDIIDISSTDVPIDDLNLLSNSPTTSNKVTARTPFNNDPFSIQNNRNSFPSVKSNPELTEIIGTNNMNDIFRNQHPSATVNLSPNLPIQNTTSSVPQTQNNESTSSSGFKHSLLNPTIDIETADLHTSPTIPITNTINNNPVSTVPEPSIREMSSEEIQKEKQDILFRLQRLHQKGVPISKKYTMSHSLHEIKEEYSRLKAQRDLDVSVKFQKKMMMAFVAGTEFLNSRYDPFDLKLDGWSETVHENSDDYDDIFEELHEKYKDKAKVAPELRLMMSLSGSAFMYHMTNSFFSGGGSGSNMANMMRQNPDVMNQMKENVINSASKNHESPFFGKFMGDMLNMVGGGGGGGNRNTTMPPQNQNSASPSNRSIMSNSTESVHSYDAFRSGMKGPSNVDNILYNLKAPTTEPLNIQRRKPSSSTMSNNSAKNVGVSLNI